MTRKLRIPMLPTELPQQRLYLVKGQPVRRLGHRRHPGWAWMLRQANAHEEFREVESRSCDGGWAAPASGVVSGDYEFVFMGTPGALYEEGRTMRHCVYDFVEDCARGERVLASVRRTSTGVRIATVMCALKDQSWKLSQIRGKTNRLLDATTNGRIAAASRGIDWSFQAQTS